MQGFKLSFWFSYFIAEEYCLIILPQASIEDETTTLITQTTVTGKKENMNNQVSYALSKGLAETLF